jgi:hypothetical protein
MAFVSDATTRMIRNDRMEPFLYSATNHLDFGPAPHDLPELEPLEELFIARVHVSVNVFTVRDTSPLKITS